MYDDRYDRQSFLGDGAQEKIASGGVGVVGLGGGGSHVVQQLAHVGFQKYVLYDPDLAEEANLNRLVGAAARDAAKGTAKVAIAKRVIRGLQPKARIQVLRKRWQDDPKPLGDCDIILGCVDGYKGRQELEIFARRHLTPYIDIGIDVTRVEPDPPVISGQVIVSLPSGPCMWCLGYLSETKLTVEAKLYGDAGSHPQVVWANGIVASAAVGLAVDLVTGWTRLSPDVVYLSYEGNRGELTPHKRLNTVKGPCVHFPPDQVANPRFFDV